MFTQYGNERVFGRALAFYPSLKLYLTKSPKNGAYVEMGSGVAFLNKRFNEFENPKNTAIGSSINNISQVKLGYYFTKGKVSLIIEGGWTHHSNIGMNQPNLGLNYWGLVAGVKYTVLRQKFSNHFQISELFYSKWELELKVTGGLFYYEEIQFDYVNAHGVVYSLTLSGIKKQSETHQYICGFKYTINNGQAKRNNENIVQVVSTQGGRE